MKSHDSPRSTSASTSATNTRVPLNVGLPWQIAGSATMYRPNSILAALRRLALLMLSIYRPPVLKSTFNSHGLSRRLRRHFDPNAPVLTPKGA